MFKNFIVKFPNRQNVYALINGELTACKVVNVTVDVENDKSFVLCESPDGFMNSFKVTELYSSVKAYEEGNSVSTVKSELKGLLPGCCEIVKENEDGVFFNMTYWVMADGEPEKRHVDAKRIVFDNGRKPTNIEMPSEYYASREECIKWNDITVVEADGTKRVQKSARRSLMLTDEQQAIVDQLCDILKKAEAAKIRFGYHADEEDLTAINVTEHPDAYFEYCGDVDERNQIGSDENLPWSRYRVNGFYGFCHIYDDYCINLGDKLD